MYVQIARHSRRVGISHAQPEGLLPAYLIQLPQSVTTVFVAETDRSTLHRYEHGEDGINFQGTHYMSVGKNGAGKQKPWDRKTPLGIYFVNERLDTTGLHERYGPMAFLLDYPNVWDRINDRDGIWMHGVTANSECRPPLDTDGCIALPNEALMMLEEGLRPMVTPVIITCDIEWSSADEISAIRQELRTVLDVWVQSYRSGDLHRYLSMYAENFSYRGMNRGEWVAYRLPAFAAALDGVALDEVLLLTDPEDADLYLTRFRQKIDENARAVVTTKRLYWRRSADGEL